MSAITSNRRNLSKPYRRDSDPSNRNRHIPSSRLRFRTSSHGGRTKTPNLYKVSIPQESRERITATDRKLRFAQFPQIPHTTIHHSPFDTKVGHTNRHDATQNSTELTLRLVEDNHRARLSAVDPVLSGWEAVCLGIGKVGDRVGFANELES